MADPGLSLRPIDFDPFEPASIPGTTFALTEPQREMWTAAAAGREATCSYNQCFSLELHGPLRVESLQAALDQVVARHAALRVVIAADGTSQTVRGPFSVGLPLVDVSASEEAERDGEIGRLLQLEVETPFDLAAGPLIRAFVVRESADQHHFVVTVHHIVCDGWSSAVLFSELGRLYSADSMGVTAGLDRAPSYEGYVRARQSDDGVAAAATDTEYWAAKYESGAPVLDLPRSGPRPAVKTYRSGRELLEIGDDLYAAVRKTGAKHGATLFSTLLATFDVLVHRLSGQSDFVVGVPFAEQGLLEDSALVAHCVNTVPVRVRLDPASAFTDHLGTVRDELAEGQKHSRLTFGSLLRHLDIPRDPSRTPLVSVTFSIDKIGAPFDFGSVMVGSITTPRSYSNFELQLNLVDSGSDVLVECDYNADLFDGPTVRRWLSYYETLLREIVANPTRPLGALPLLTDEERSTLEQAAGTRSFPASGCLHERFSEQARRVPERVAVSCEEESLRYDELERRANALAHELRAAGVSQGVLVGLRCERSLELVVGILAILKAGGGYLPLDPAYPRERVEFILEDAQVPIVLSERAFASDFDPERTTLLFLEDARAEQAEGPETQVSPADVAYVIYTSGSTGKPKGVVVTHYNVTRLFDATEEWFHFTEDDVWTLFHSYAFDFSVWELWGALLHGGRLVVVPYWVSRSPEEFRRLLVEEQVSVLNQTPSAFRQLIAADVHSGPPVKSALRYVVFGGEALELQSLAPWFERYGDEEPRLVNMYGITETTVHVTYRPLSMADLEQGAGSVIGVPIPDLRVLLFDPQGELVPTGVVGELYVGGAGVARGYLGRPELTAERFGPDPFAGDGGSRLYRTGDLARRLDNGDLEYLGRSDEQVKVRGFRIELGEIEAVLQSHPQVRACAVLARSDVASDPRLVAYVVREEEEIGLEELRAHLQRALPEYMLPAHVVFLDSLPLTANGKLDRQALPVPELGRQEQEGTPYVAPRTPTQETIAGIWASVLQAPRVGIEDSFFELGGDSMAAAQIVAALRSAFDVDVAMRHLFERPTIAGLGDIVDLLAVATVAVRSSDGAPREEIEI